MAEKYYEDQIKRGRLAFAGLSRAAWQIERQKSVKPGAFGNETFEAAQWAWRTSAGSALSKMAARLGAGDTKLGRAIRQIQDLNEQNKVLQEKMTAQLIKQSQIQRNDETYQKLASLMREKNREAHKKVDQLRHQRRPLQARINAINKEFSAASSPYRKTLADQRATLFQHMQILNKKEAELRKPVLDLIMKMNAREKKIGAARGENKYKQIASKRSRLSRQIAKRKKAVTLSFPEYKALADPKPLSIKSTQKLLGPNEALLVYLVGKEKSFVWAISKNAFDWAQIDLGAAALEKIVVQLRQGLDPSNQVQTGPSRGFAVDEPEGDAKVKRAQGLPFNLATSHSLYKALIAPVHSVVKNKRHLLVVPARALTGLPFHVLVSEKPDTALPDYDGYKKAAWLMKTHAIAVLPSVPSLRALRKFARKEGAALPFIGFGDPVLIGPSSDGARGARGQAQGTAKLAAPGDMADYYRGKLADVSKVRSLTPLPDTSDELQAIAQKLGVSLQHIKLGEAATEQAVKSSPLDQYQVVHFATHGLVAGDLARLGEPALVLTPPQKASYEDDGLLTASEVASLKLNADWVVLSACNTASGDRPGAEGLSGLARAFFYAGARSMLVSHWPVYSDAAVKITTGAFAQLKDHPTIKRPEALRRSMLEILETGDPHQAHPAYWAPFILVGDGGGAQ